MSDDKNGRPIDGFKIAVELLNDLDDSARETLLNNMALKDPTLVQRLKDSLFTFNDIVKLGERTMQSLIKQIPQKTLAMAFRAAPDEVKNHFFNNMSIRAAQLLKEDIESLGPQKLSSVKSAQQEIVNLIKNLGK